MIRPYLRDIINNHKTPLGKITDDDLYGEWKIQLTMQINFISSPDPGEIRTMDSKSKNIEILMGSIADHIANDLFESFFRKTPSQIRRKNER